MKITEITVVRKKNLGNYETTDLSITANVEGNDVNKAVDDLSFFVDYKLNQAGRDERLALIQKELEEGQLANGKELTDEAKDQRLAWIDKYNEAVERANNLEFV